MHVDVYYKTAVPPIRERYGVGLDARFTGPGLYIYCTGGIAICTVHSWIDEVRHGVGRAAENRFADVRFLSCIDTRPIEDGLEGKRRDKTETRNRKQGRRAESRDWLAERLQVWQIRTHVSHVSPTALPSLLPRSPCTIGYQMVWLVRGYHVVCKRKRVGGLWGGRGCAEERGIRVHRRSPCDLPKPVDASRDHLHGGPSSPSRLCGQVAAGSKQVGRGKMHLKIYGA